jgi:hypothetical protein
LEERTNVYRFAVDNLLQTAFRKQGDTKIGFGERGCEDLHLLRIV